MFVLNGVDKLSQLFPDLLGGLRGLIRSGTHAGISEKVYFDDEVADLS
jgi:hypothetical protein